MPESPRTVDQALQFAQAEHQNESEDWTGYCQRFVRSCYGIPIVVFGTAYAQWLGLDDEDRHAGGKPSDAPLGAALFYKGASAAGHVDLAARNDGAWSNDLIRTGDIDFVSRTAPTQKWGQRYLGWGSAINGYDLPLKTGVAKPKQDKPYKTIGAAVDRLEHALELALQRGEKKDARMIRGELRDLRDLYQVLRHA